MLERTFIILKPDALKRKLVGEILKRFEQKNFQIVSLSTAVLDKALVEEHYAHIAHIPPFQDIVNFMISSPVIVMILEGEKVIAEVRRMMGSTFDALPGTIRGDFAFYADNGANLIHASDSVETATLEIQRFQKYLHSLN